MIILKTERDLAAMRPACAIAGGARSGCGVCAPDLTTQEVDEYAAIASSNMAPAARFSATGNIRVTFAFRSMTKWCTAWPDRAGFALAIS